MNCTKRNSPREILWLQWIGGIAAMLGLTVTGLTKGWTSPYMALLMSEDSPISITKEEASWVASLVNFGRLLGAILGAVSLYFSSSKRTLVITGIPLLLSWIMIVVADSATWLYISRLSSGISMGMIYASFPLFIGEISSPKIRGTLVSFGMSGMSVGVLWGNVMGTYVSMAVFSYISLVPTVLFIVIFMWLPETPHDLIRMQRIDDAKKAIKRYSPSIDADREFKIVNDFVNASESITFRNRLREFNLPQNRMAGLIIVLLFAFMQFSGVNTVTFYTETILIEAELEVIKPATMVIIVTSIGTVAAFVASYTADKFGRKILLIGSSAGILIAMIGLGIHFTLINGIVDSGELQWLPIISVVIYQLALCFGHAMIPNIVLSELFAPRIKSMASCLAGITTGGFAFMSSKSFQPLVNAFDMASVFWMHAVLMALCILFVLTLMPETRCKTLQEIQEKLETRQMSK